MQFFLRNIDETEAWGHAFYRTLPEKALVFFHGNLGMGKTSLIRGMLREAGFAGTVRSPTYSLVEEYILDARRIYHFDLYRLKDPEELEWIGMDDYLKETALCLIEWPQMGAGILPQPDMVVSLQSKQDGRMLEIEVLRQELKNTLLLLWKNKDILL